jgi:succinate dehydrogenase / fumarate reductase membrane anchor subunit
MRESSLRLVNYVMMSAILVTLGIHLAAHAFLGVSGYPQSLTYDTVVARYRDVTSATLLGVLLVAATFHGLYGLRSILLDVRSGPRWSRAVSVALLAIGFGIVGWGLRTIALVRLGGS